MIQKPLVRRRIDRAIPFTQYLNIRKACGPTFSPDGKRLAFISNITGVLQAWVVNSDGGWPDQSAAASSEGQWLLWVSNVEGAHQFSLLDLHTNQVRQPETLPLGVTIDYMAPVFSPDRRRIAFSYSTPTRTPDIWVWNIEENRVFAVTQSSHAGIPSSSFREPELIHYPSIDNLLIPAWFYRPVTSRDEKYPSLGSVHGGPEGQAQPFLDYVVQYLASRGLGVFIPKVRGSSGYGKKS